MKKERTRGEKIIAFAEGYLRVPEGKLIGQPIKLLPFQKKFILDVYDNPVGTRRGILTTARKNGKTGLIAILLLAHLVGPEAKRNTQIVSGAMSREQAALVFDLAKKMVELSPQMKNRVRIRDSGKKLIGLARNVEYKALAAEGKTAHGLSPILAILDEIGQVVGTKDAFIEAILTSQGAHEAPLVLAISTQAANDSDLLSTWIDDAKNSDDKRIVCHVHETPKSMDLLDEEGWKLSNPALGAFRSYEDLKAQMIEASRMPSAESTARNLLLNQRVSIRSPFISKLAWDACIGELPRIQDCSAIYGGLDLSQKNDLTALVLIGQCDDKWHIYPHFWMPQKGIEDKAKRDRAPYDVWARQGFIKTPPAASIEYNWLAYDIVNILNGLHVNAIAFDRWRIDVLKRELELLGIELPLVEWGQGFKDMSPALDALEGRILNETILHNNNPVLNMCAQNSMLIKNPAGDRKLDKMKTSGRIDGMVALCMAAGISERNNEFMGDINDFVMNPIVI
jgi:phage terminase large subunit-like protein